MCLTGHFFFYFHLFLVLRWVLGTFMFTTSIVLLVNRFDQFRNLCSKTTHFVEDTGVRGLKRGDPLGLLCIGLAQGIVRRLESAQGVLRGYICYFSRVCRDTAEPSKLPS